MNPSFSPWQPWLLHKWCVLPLQCSKPRSLSNQYAVSNTHPRQGVAVCLVSRFHVCVCAHVCLLNSKAFTRLSDEGSNQSRVNATSEPRPLLFKELLCHFAPTCTSLTPLRNLGPRAAGESKILGSVSRSSQGRPRTFRDAAETIRKSRASLSVSVIKLGGKLECVCAVFFFSSLQLQDFCFLTTGSTEIQNKVKLSST